MANFFPRQTIEWRLDEPPAFRRLSLSLVEMALLTGVVLRLLRAFAFTHGRASVLFSIGAVAVWAIVLIGMTTAHMANYPLRRWAWRGPLFGLMETVGEMLTSLVLIALHREPNGTARAEFHDWPTMGARALLQSELTICLWVLLLSGVIVIARNVGMAKAVDSDPLDPELPTPRV
jgi:hypothetical protein